MGKKKYKIAVFPGDGIGPEIVREALKVLKAVSEHVGVAFELEEGLAGGIAYDKYGDPLPKESMDMALKSDAILLGAVEGRSGKPWITAYGRSGPCSACGEISAFLPICGPSWSSKT